MVVKEEVDFTCDGRLNSNNYEAIKLTCSLEGIIVFENDLPSVALINLNDGNYFKDVKYSRNCTTLVTAEPLSHEFQALILAKNVTGILSLDPNLFQKYFDFILVQIVFRIVFGLAFLMTGKVVRDKIDINYA